MSEPVAPIQNLGEGVADKAKQLFTTSANESWIIILVLGVMILLVIIVVYIFQMIQNNKMKNVVMHDKLIDLGNKSVVPYLVKDDKLSLVSNGQEYSYSFWIFLSNTYDSTDKFKPIIHRGNTNITSNIYSPSTSPLISMDKTTNKMYIAVSTLAVSVDMTSDQIFQQDQNTGKFTSGHLVTYIDYVSLQRWVNVVLVIRDSNMYVYLDGDIYSTTNVMEVNSSTRSMIKGTQGNLVIGDSQSSTNGYISQTSFFNYALTQKEIAKLYKNGPAKSSWLALFGLGNYGVRSPVYELE